jgi:hypothetical protein
MGRPPVNPVETKSESNDQNLWMALGGAGVKSRTSPRKI